MARRGTIPCIPINLWRIVKEAIVSCHYLLAKLLPSLSNIPKRSSNGTLLAVLDR